MINLVVSSDGPILLDADVEMLESVVVGYSVNFVLVELILDCKLNEFVVGVVVEVK